MKRILTTLFLFLYLIVLICCREMRIAWISPTNSAQYPINAENSVTGVKFGIQSIRSNKALLKNQVIRLKHFDTNCNSRSAIVAFMLARSTYDPDVIIGPPCADALRGVSELASYHNLPVLAWIAPNREFDDKTAHPTLIRMQPPVNEMTSVLQYLFYLMSWRKFTLLYIKDGNSNEATGEAVEAVARVAGLSLLSSHALNPVTTDEEIKQILSQIKLYSRVIVLAVPWVDMRRYMLIASKLDMTNGEYVFICLDRQIYTEDQLNQAVLSSYGWQRSDNFDKEAKQAFESVLHIIMDPLNEDRDEPVTKTPKNRYKEFLQVTARIMGNKDLVGVEAPKGTQPDPNALFLYDTLLVWAVLAGTLTNKMENHRDGAKMSEIAKDFYATGASGHIAINTNRDRVGKVFILDMKDNGEFQPIQVIRFNSSGNYDMFNLAEPSRMFSWGNGKAGINNAPSDEPNITAICPAVATKQPIFRPETLSRSMILTPPFTTRERLPVLERIKLAQQIISEGARKPLITQIIEATVTPKRATLPVTPTMKPPTTTTERTTTSAPTTTTEQTTTTTSPYITTTTLAPKTTSTTVTTTTTTTPLPTTTTNPQTTTTIEPTTGEPSPKPSPEVPVPAETLEMKPKANIIGDWPRGKNGVPVEQRTRMAGGPRAGPQRQPGARRRIRLRPGQDPPGAALRGRQGQPTKDQGSQVSPEDANQITPETSSPSEPVAPVSTPQTPFQPEFPSAVSSHSQQQHQPSFRQQPPPQHPPSQQSPQSEPRIEAREPTVRQPHMRQGGPHAHPLPPQQNMILRNQSIPQPPPPDQPVRSHASPSQQPPNRQPQPPPQQPSFQPTASQQSPQHPPSQQPPFQQPPAHHPSPQQPPSQRQPPPPPQRQPSPPPQRQPPPPPQRQQHPPPRRQQHPPPQRQPISPVQVHPSVIQGQPNPGQVQSPQFQEQPASQPQGQPQHSSTKQAFQPQGPPNQPPYVMMPPRPPPQRPSPPPVIRQVQVNSWAPVIPPASMEPGLRPNTWSGHATIAPVPDFWGGWTGPQTTTATWWEALL